MTQGASPSPEGPALTDLASRLADEARQWLGAEIELARAQTGALSREAITAAIMIAVAIAFGIAGLVMAAITITALIEPHLGEVLAGLVVTILFCAVAAALVFASRAAVGRASNIARRIGAHVSFSRDIK